MSRSGPRCTHPWNLGRLAPLVLPRWLRLDLGLRFLPLHWFRVPPLIQAVRRIYGARSSPFLHFQF